MTALMDPIQQIEARRIAASLSIDNLSTAAGLSRQHYFNIRCGKRTANRAVIARLKAALGRLTGRPADLAAPEIRMVLYVYLAVLGLVCSQAGVPTASVHAQDPGKRATANPAWLAASKLRRQAIYLVNAALGIEQADIAKAIGLTPAAISLACRAIEDEREDGDMDRLMDELTRTITGDQG